MPKFWDEGRTYGLTLNASDWSLPLVLNNVPTPGVRDEDDGARMAGGFAIDGNGKLQTAMFRHFCLAGAVSRFSRLQYIIEQDLSSATVADIVAYQAGSVSAGYDPRLRLFATAGEWAPTCAFDILNANGIFIDNTGNNTTTSYYRKLYTTNTGGSWTQNTLTSMSGTFYNFYNATVDPSGGDVNAGVAAANNEGSAPTQVLSRTTNWDGVSDATPFFWFTVNASNYGGYVDGYTTWSYTRNMSKGGRTRSDRYVNANAYSPSGNWNVTGIVPTSGVGNYSNTTGTLFSFLVWPSPSSIDPNASIAVWKSQTGGHTEVNDIVVMVFADPTGAIRVARYASNAYGAPTGSDLSGASNSPSAVDRPTIYAGQAPGANGIEVCHDRSTKGRLFVVTQLLDSEMRMFYSDNAGLNWTTGPTITGAATLFPYANGSKDNRSRFFIASPSPDKLYVMALTDVNGKPEWAVTRWVQPT